jgi:ATP-dependent Clp protease adaptor protein ClpS
MTMPEKLFNLVLLDDGDHSYDYVIGMLEKLFDYPPTEGFQLAKEVDTQGRVVVLTAIREYAQLKQDQIHAFGPDPLIPRCKGSMSAVIEPAPG